MTTPSPFDNKKLQLMTKTLPNGSFPPSLKFDIYNDNPQIFVLTGNKKGEGPTFIRAGLEHKTAGLLCQLIEMIADSVIKEYTTGVPSPDSGENTIVSIECKSGKERETTSKIVTGKLKDNKMFISLVDTKDNSVPVIQFMFQPDLFHPLAVTGSDKLTASLSAAAAKEWAIRARAYWYTYSINNPKEAAPKGNGNYGNNNGGGNNYNNNSNDNNGGGNYSQSNSGGGSEPLPWES